MNRAEVTPADNSSEPIIDGNHQLRRIAWQDGNMAAIQLKSDATIRDVQTTLGDPEEYVRVVLSHMMECARANGNAGVRIGVTGRGIVPSHKVTFSAPNGSEELFEAYGGETKFTDVIVRDGQTWSDASMSVEEARNLLGALPSIKKRPAMPHGA